MLYNSLHNRALRLVVAVIGELIAAAALNLFIVPLHLYTGGLMGVCQLLRTLAADYLGVNFGAYDVAGILYFLLNIPILLVATIELAIFINQGIPYFTGAEIPFIAPTVIGCIQLGATVDYSILLGTRYQEELRRGGDRKEAMVRAATSSDNSIITGGLVLFSACLSVALISHIDLVAALCVMLARGTLISVAVCLFLLPPILVVCEPLIARTSKNWKTAPQPKAETPVLTASTEKE